MTGRSDTVDKARPSILTTTGYPQRAEWIRHADPVRARAPLGVIREIIARAPDYDAVVLAASQRPQQVAAALLAKMRPRKPVLLQDSTWKLGRSRLDRAASRAAVRLTAGPSTHFCVLTRYERDQFAHTWGVDPAHVHRTPWYCGLSDEQLAAPVSQQGYVFAGGDSMRDYRPLLEAAKSVPAPIRIAARQAPPIDRSSLPANVEFGPMTEADYFSAMCDASVIVVALAGGTERSAGQNNYLNPMALGKLVILTEGTGVSDYVEHRRSAIVVPVGDDEALGREIAWCLDPSNAEAVRTIAEEGRRTVLERFSPDRYVERLLGVVGEIV